MVGDCIPPAVFMMTGTILISNAQPGPSEQSVHGLSQYYGDLTFPEPVAGVFLTHTLLGSFLMCPPAALPRSRAS